MNLLQIWHGRIKKKKIIILMFNYSNFSDYFVIVFQVAKTVAQRLNTDPMLLQFFKSQG